MAPQNSKTAVSKPVVAPKPAAKEEKPTAKPATAPVTKAPAPKAPVVAKAQSAAAVTKTPAARPASAPKLQKKSLSARLFKKKSDTAAADVTPKVVVRAKSFKRIRGFLKGRSKKTLASTPSSETNETASSRRANLSASVGIGAQGDDGSVYNVTLDERSVASSVTGDASTVGMTQDKYLLRMVLLLMDVNTRRFELLQLEFDSEKAVVADVLTQVPVSVTEEKLRSQKYSGLVTADGKEMKTDKLLTEFCTGNDVLVAVPEGVDPNESTRLAKPILCDRKVVNMLKNSGLDTTKWVKSSQQEKPVESIAEQKIEETDEVEEQEVATRELPNFAKAENTPSSINIGTVIFGFLFVALGVAVAAMVHKYISTPIQPGHTVSPGIVLSKCGLDFWSGCEPGYLKVEPGLVSLYEGNKTTASWVIHGHSCPEEKVKDKTCVDGLVFNKEGKTLWLGGEPIKWLEHYSDDGKKIETAQLVPWPFAEEPKIKAWDIKAGKVAPISGHIADEAKKAASKVKNRAGGKPAAKVEL